MPTLGTRKTVWKRIFSLGLLTKLPEHCINLAGLSRSKLAEIVQTTLRAIFSINGGVLGLMFALMKHSLRLKTVG